MSDSVSYQSIRTVAARVMGQPVVMQLLEADRAMAVHRLVVAKDLPDIYRAQAEVTLLDRMLNDIKNVKK